MHRHSLILLLVALLIIFSGCRGSESKLEEHDLVRVKEASDQNAKKVILICIDSLMSSAIDSGIKQNKLPAFKFLIEHGQYYRNVVSSFPTMSVTVDSSLLTGAHPNQHRVPGLLWYSKRDKKIVNYGSGPMDIISHGINPMLTNLLMHLNGKHLNSNTPTIFEDLAKRGLTSGSVNGLIYRGTTDHYLSMPAWVHVPTTLPEEINVKGPDFFAFGALSNPLEGKKNLPEELHDRLGMNNSYSLEVVKYLVQTKALPDFLYVYFPDLDQKMHKKGPPDLEGLIRTDEQLQSLLQAFGSPEQALKKAVFMIIGDSGMTNVVPAGKQPVVDLPETLNRLEVLRPGATVTDTTDVVLAVNETMAYVYKLKTETLYREIADALRTDKRIDFIAWKENGWIHVVQGGTSEELRYRNKGRWTDQYQQTWTLDKNPLVLDIKLDRVNRTLDYGEYPDVLQRLSAALSSHDGDFLVVTAKPGYELADKSSPRHKGGGAHGSLRKSESLVPLIVTGTNRTPRHLRIVDIKRFVLGEWDAKDHDQ